MTLHQAMFKVKHDCPFGSISEKHPSAKIFKWYNPDSDVVEIITENPRDCLPIIKELSKLADVLQEHSEGAQTHLVMARRSWTLENSVTANIEASNLLQVPPEMYEKGWEYFNVIAFRHEDLQRLLQSLENKGFKVEVLRKSLFRGFIVNSSVVNVDAVFSVLTQKQIDALLTSYEHGYYKLPRKKSLTEIAKNKQIARTTFEEHLRKAENKLMTNLVPYLRLFERTSREKESRFNTAVV